jgi:hypothetical protein
LLFPGFAKSGCQKGEAVRLVILSAAKNLDLLPDTAKVLHFVQDDMLTCCDGRDAHGAQRIPEDYGAGEKRVRKMADADMSKMAAGCC